MIALLKYYIKKRLYVIGILSSITIIIALILSSGGYIYEYDRYYDEINNEIVKMAQNCPIELYAFIAAVLVLIIPIFEFSFKMKKVSIDEFYKYPIKREKLYMVKYILGLIEILIPLTVYFLFTFLDIAFKEHLFDLGSYVIFYLISIPVIFSTYSIFTFIYAKCNTIYDGLINLTFIQFFFVAIIYMITEIVTYEGVCLLSPDSGCWMYYSYFFVYSPITRLAAYGTEYMGQSSYVLESPLSNTDIASIISIIFFFILGVVALILLIFNLKKDKSENSMDISSSWFSYKVMLPTFIVVLSYISTQSASGIFVILLVAVSGYIGYTIYRRTFKIKLCDVITIASSLLLGLGIGVIVWLSF